jgi:LmbE family N-acetylglucosaminyl deacetylase
MTVTPAIFYAPHQDDEAIGMAGAICEQKEAGREVVLVLLTNGLNEDLVKLMNGKIYCRWHHRRHHHNLSMEQMMWARKVEFVQSARRLGADKVFILDDGQGLDDLETYNSYESVVERIASTIQHFELKFPGASHNLVAGNDLNPYAGSTNPTHQACWEAASSLRPGITDFKFYRIYEYWKSPDQRTAQFQITLTPSRLKAKRAALLEYKHYHPPSGRFALGYHSVPTLIEAAYKSDQEYHDTF